MIIDAKKLIAGRLATVVAKKALLGEGISILNAEKAIISGGKLYLYNKVKNDFDRGTPVAGPFIPKEPERFLKRIIRGMLPYKQAKGAAAYKRIKCYAGIPENFKDQKIEVIEGAKASKLPNVKYLSIQQICKNLGGKQ